MGWGIAAAEPRRNPSGLRRQSGTPTPWMIRVVNRGVRSSSSKARAYRMAEAVDRMPAPNRQDDDRAVLPVGYACQYQ